MTRTGRFFAWLWLAVVTVLAAAAVALTIHQEALRGDCELKGGVLIEKFVGWDCIRAEVIK